MASFSEQSIEKRLRSLSGTQDSIQSVALWILHHKVHAEKITAVWCREGKKANAKERLVYLYLCNEIVQTCDKRRASVFKDAFKGPLKEMIFTFRNEEELLPKLTRMVTIWVERKIYDTEYLGDLTQIIETVAEGGSPPSEDSKTAAEFQPSLLMELILTFKSLEDQVEMKRRQITTMRLDLSSQEAIKKLKDRAHGSEFSQQFDDSCVKLDEYVTGLEREMEQRSKLIELLEQSELFYEAQYGEAKVVANAYKNFGTRINAQKKKLAEHRAMLNDPDSPIPSPSADAPSPGKTPPQHKTVDNTEVADMELSDEEGRMNARPESTAVTSTVRSPVSSVLQIHMGTRSRGVTPQGKASGNRSPPSPVGSPVGLSPTQTTPGGAAKSFIGNSSTEAGSTTPVQDEKADDITQQKSTKEPLSGVEELWQLAQSWSEASVTSQPAPPPLPSGVAPPPPAVVTRPPPPPGPYSQTHQPNLGPAYGAPPEPSYQNRAFLPPPPQPPLPQMPRPPAPPVVTHGQPWNSQYSAPGVAPPGTTPYSPTGPAPQGPAYNPGGGHYSPPPGPPGNVPYSPSMPPAPPRTPSGDNNSNIRIIAGGENEFRDMLKRKTSQTDGAGQNSTSPPPARRPSSNLTEIKLDHVPGPRGDVRMPSRPPRPMAPQFPPRPPRSFGPSPAKRGRGGGGPRGWMTAGQFESNYGSW